MKNNEHISLEKIGNKKPFEVPENYFEKFANLMDDEIGYKQVTTVLSVRGCILQRPL